MKTTITFDDESDDYDDSKRIRTILADSAWFALWDFDQRLRSIAKHDQDSTRVELAQQLRDELLDSLPVTFDSIIC
jgi:hypothetical protein